MSAYDESVSFQQGDPVSASKLQRLADRTRPGREPGPFTVQIPGLPVMRRRPPTRAGATDFTMAEITAISGKTVTCKWVDPQVGGAAGSEFTVYLFSYTDQNNSVGQQLVSALYPALAVGQFIRVYQQQRTIWTGSFFQTGWWAVDRFDIACDP